MKTMAKASLLASALVCALALPVHAADPKIENKQTEIRTMSQDTLKRLYKVDPKAQAAVEGAAGYAVFSNMGVKILLAGSGTGKGIAVDNKSKKETYMKMIELQAGLGMGVKKFRVIFVFDNEKVLDSFVNSGWEFGGQATAAAKAGDKVDRWQERRRCRTASGCTSSPTPAWPPKSPPRARSTTKTMI